MDPSLTRVQSALTRVQHAIRTDAAIEFPLASSTTLFFGWPDESGVLMSDFTISKMLNEVKNDKKDINLFFINQALT